MSCAIRRHRIPVPNITQHIKDFAQSGGTRRKWYLYTPKTVCVQRGTDRWLIMQYADRQQSTCPTGAVLTQQTENEISDSVDGIIPRFSALLVSQQSPTRLEMSVGALCIAPFHVRRNSYRACNPDSALDLLSHIYVIPVSTAREVRAQIYRSSDVRAYDGFSVFR